MARSSLLAAVAVFAGLALVGGGLAFVKYRALHPAAGPAWEPADAVEVVAAREVSWQPTADLVGNVLSLRSVEVRTELAAKVREVRFESGSIVEQGQVLLTLDDTTEQADLAAADAAVRVAEANVVSADARVRLADAELRRMAQVARGGIASEIELDRSRAELDRSVADRLRTLAEVDLAKARADQVRARLAKLTVVAPFRARVGLRRVHEGQYLAEGTSIVMLEEVSDKVYLDFAIPQDHVPRVQRGVVVMGSAPLLGPAPVRIEVVALDASVDFDTRNVRVRAVVENRADVLRPGMFIQLRVPTEEPRPYVVVPTTAVRRTSYADQVFVVLPATGEPPQRRAKQRFVKLGPTIGDDVIVLEGIAAGDEVASTGSFKLRDGGLVNPAAKATTQASTADQ